MFVRNNLTGVELLEMTARGVHGELRFGTTAMMSGVRGASAESGGLLKFEVKEKHLKDCYRKFGSINIIYNLQLHLPAIATLFFFGVPAHVIKPYKC